MLKGFEILKIEHCYSSYITLALKDPDWNQGLLHQVLCKHIRTQGPRPMIVFKGSKSSGIPVSSQTMVELNSYTINS